MIHVNCPDCGRSYLLAPNTQGKRATCNECGSQFAIPRAQVKQKESGVKGALRTERRQPTDPVSRVKQVTELLERIDEFPHPSVSIGYRITSLFVALMMLVLPLLYLGFVTGVGWLTWWHITNNHTWMTVPMGGRAMLVAQLVYVGLSFAGVVWTLSLIKPLFKSMPKPDDDEGLDREDEPALFAFAETLADKVGAPRPEIIHLLLDCNAYASYGTTAFGLVRKEFTLAVGIPLIGGLTLPQLAGVMAHEFGHFSQRGCSFQRRVIHRINRWFQVAVYEYDYIDEIIAHLTDSDGGHAFLFILGMIMWCLVGLGRMVLWCLMFIGMVVSGTLMRRAEFDADRYETALVGSKVFEESAERIVALNIAHEVAKTHVFDSAYGEHLPRDFTAFIVGLADKSRKVKKATSKLIKEERLHLMASHPPTRARIAAANRLDEPGVFHSKLPGSALIGNFQSKCTEQSQDLYEAKFGDNFIAGTLRPTADVVQGYLNTMERK